MSEDLAVIANITDQQWVLHRTYGTFIVPPCLPGQAYALTEITARNGRIDLGDKRSFDFPITAREIAEDIAREVNSDGGDASFFGVLVCAGGQPTEAELVEARKKIEDFYKKLVYVADQEWERSHNYMIISDVQRRAARWLGLEKQWAYDPRPLAECPACGEKVKPGVAVCRSCGAILDREKALQFGLISLATASESAPGRPAERDDRGAPLAVSPRTEPRPELGVPHSGTASPAPARRDRPEDSPRGEGKRA